MSEAKKRLIVDQDGTLARFHDEVAYLEQMYEEGFFRNLKPFENMVEAIKLFKKVQPDAEVFLCTSCIESPFCQSEKDAWMDEYLPEIDEGHRIYAEMGKSKADYLPGGATEHDFLLDDYNIGLQAFMDKGGSAIKCRNNINHKGLGAHGGEKGNLWLGAMVNANDKPEMIVAGLCDAMGLEYDLDMVLKAYDIEKLPADMDWDEMCEVTKGKDTAFIKVIDDGYLGIDGKNTGYKAQFKNPLNCVAWLNGDDKSLEVMLQGPSTKDNMWIASGRLEDFLANMEFEGTLEEFLDSYTPDDFMFYKEELDRFIQQEKPAIDKDRTEINTAKRTSISEELEAYYERLVKVPDVQVRIGAVKEGIALDKFVSDPDWRVRYAVAEKGYGLHILLNDEHPMVRKAVAAQRFGHDFLVKDPDYLVRAEVANQGSYLDILSKDKHKFVRETADRVLKEKAFENIYVVVENYKGLCEHNFFGTKKDLQELLLIPDEEFKERFTHYWRSDVSYDIVQCHTPDDFKRFMDGLYNDTDRGEVDPDWYYDFDAAHNGKEALKIVKDYAKLPYNIGFYEACKTFGFFKDSPKMTLAERMEQAENEKQPPGHSSVCKEKEK